MIYHTVYKHNYRQIFSQSIFLLIFEHSNLDLYSSPRICTCTHIHNLRGTLVVLVCMMLIQTAYVKPCFIHTYFRADYRQGRLNAEFLLVFICYHSNLYLYSRALMDLYSELYSGKMLQKAECKEVFMYINLLFYAQQFLLQSTYIVSKLPEYENILEMRIYNFSFMT